MIGSKPLEQGLLEKLRLQSVLLDPAYKTHKAKETTRLHKRLSAKKKREMKLYEIPKAQQRFGHCTRWDQEDEIAPVCSV